MNSGGITPHSGTGNEGTGTVDDVFHALAERNRRQVLRALLEETGEDVVSGQVPRGTLAAAIAAKRHDLPREEVGPSERHRVELTLHHRHLPTLDAAGLVAYDPEQGSVVRRTHDAYRDDGIRAAIHDETSGAPDTVDALFGALASERNRRILDVLSHQIGPIHVETLASDLFARGRPDASSTVDRDSVERVRETLYHRHLPRLAAADLVAYDSSDETVAYEGHPDLRVPWMHSVLQPDFRASLTGESDSAGVSTVEGRESVVSFGQSLCDRADDELFCLFTAPNLLEAGCLTRIRDATARGVDVSIGTCDPAIRDYVRENAPDVELWEPRTDWLDLPIEDDRVGRLLVADRDAVMLGTLGDETGDGRPRERALIGEGRDNTFVAIIRQILQPRLDQFGDAPQESVAELPF